MRVSTIAQTLAQQNAALEAAGVTKTFSDTMSGARDDRPGVPLMQLFPVVWSIDLSADLAGDLRPKAWAEPNYHCIKPM
jgi:Resolvase, N terminal domain